MPHPSITAQTYPHKAAVIMGGSGETMSYQALDERSNQAAQKTKNVAQNRHAGEIARF